MTSAFYTSASTASPSQKMRNENTRREAIKEILTWIAIGTFLFIIAPCSI